MTTKIKTNNGSTVAVSEDGTVTIDNVVISFEPQNNNSSDESAEKITIHALKKIATFNFGHRGYTTTDSRQIRRLVLDALRNIGERATV